MYLKELDLHGFKSFPEKVKLEFNKGITAVVGPNGSGKSNISDAVKWVLGEQRAKSLRGGKMEDVIFAGTANRRPVGFAEVSMTIDNTDKKIPVEYSEITITRRVYRSGESGYYINGTECRLKDIYELFMDTGIGRDGYSIIGQGRIDEILSNKSEDRRQLFEEAAGIVKYKNRRAEAESNLEKEQQNLVRITDIISEIESKIGPLEKQAEKAKKYLELYGQMKEADIRLFVINGQKIEEGIQEVNKLLEDTEANIADGEDLLKRLTEESADIKEAANQLDLEIENLNRKLAEISGLIEKNDGICLLTEEQIRNLKESFSRLETDKNSRIDKTKENQENIVILTESLNSAKTEMETIKAAIAEKEEALNVMLSEQSEYEQKTESYKAEMIECIKLTADLKGSLERTDAVIEQFIKREKQLADEKEIFKDKLRERRIALNAAELRLEENSDEIEETEKEIRKLEGKKDGFSKIISVIETGLEEKSRKLAEKESRLKVLSDMEKEHDGYYKSVKAILQLKDNGNPAFKDVRGAVAQLFKTDEKYETAIETALGGSMQSIVVKNENDAKTAVSYLKEHRLGRATFLPVSTVKGRTLGAEKDALLAEKGVIAAAVDLVKYDKEFSGIAESLLGRILVIDTMDNAISFAARHKQSYRLVTLEGESFMPGGAITGGSSGKKDGGVFGRKREIDSLKTETEALKAACSGLAAERDSNMRKAEETNELIEEKKNDLKELEFEKITAVSEATGIKKEISEYEEKIRLSGIEEEQLSEQKKTAYTDKEKSASELSKTQRKILELQDMLNKYKEDAESGKSGRTSAAEEITELKIKLSSISEKSRAKEDDIKRLSSENVELADEIEKIENEKNDTQLMIAEKEKLAEEAANMTKSSREEKEKL